MPHRHMPFWQISPAPQQFPDAPHSGPSGQPPVGAHGSGLIAPSEQVVHASAHVFELQVTTLSLHVHALQPSPSANVSPE
jgi:hypothetical protein